MYKDGHQVIIIIYNRITIEIQNHPYHLVTLKGIFRNYENNFEGIYPEIVFLTPRVSK